MGDLRAAGHAFSEGERAFIAGDFTRAAEAFEAAYAHAPSEDALWNAAQARHRAGDLARAANLYARYLQRAPSGARDRDRATAILEQLAGRVARIEVQAPGADVVTVDDVPLEGRFFYVQPGSHIVRARRGDRDEQRTPTVGAGQVLSVAFPADVPPAKAPASTDTSPLSLTASPSSEDASDHAPGGVERAPPSRPRGPTAHGWNPWVFAVEGGVTVGAAVATLASAIDTRRARNAFDAAPSQQALADGQAKETRTNVLLGATAGLGALTAATGIWLVRWQDGDASAAVGARTGVGVGGGVSPGVTVAGSF